MLKFILRLPFAVLGGICLISMLEGVILLHGNVLFLVHAFQSVTQPIWDFLLGWFFDLFKLPFPSWARDYLTMGVICLLAAAKTPISSRDIGLFEDPLQMALEGLLIILFWPFLLALMALQVLGSFFSEDPEGRQSVIIFFEFILWAFIFIAVSYALFIYKGG
jgi:hypothetical protein